MKKLIALLFALVLALNCVSALAEGTLRVGMECGYAPYNWQQTEENEFTARIADGSGFADGYDVQIARRIAQALDMDLEIVKTEWDGLIPSVLSGNIDLIIAGMSPTAERKMTIDFTDYYYQSELVVVVRKDGAYANAKSLSDLSGAVICAQLNTFHDTVIDQIPGVVHDIPRETFPAMIVNLLSGAIDGYIAETTEASEVQQLFEIWWPLRRGMAHVGNDEVSFPVGGHVNNLGLPMPTRTKLRFPKSKLTAEQIAKASHSGVGDLFRGIIP